MYGPICKVREAATSVDGAICVRCIVVVTEKLPVGVIDIGSTGSDHHIEEPIIVNVCEDMEGERERKRSDMVVRWCDGVGLDERGSRRTSNRRHICVSIMR